MKDRESSKFSLNLSVSNGLSLKLSQQERELLNCDRALDLWHNKNADTNLYEVAACVARLSKKNYTFHLRSRPRARHTHYTTHKHAPAHTHTHIHTGTALVVAKSRLCKWQLKVDSDKNAVWTHCRAQRELTHSPGHNSESVTKTCAECVENLKDK